MYYGEFENSQLWKGFRKLIAHSELNFPGVTPHSTGWRHGSYYLEKVLNFTGRLEKSLNSV